MWIKGFHLGVCGMKIYCGVCVNERGGLILWRGMGGRLGGGGLGEAGFIFG